MSCSDSEGRVVSVLTTQDGEGNGLGDRMSDVREGTVVRDVHPKSLGVVLRVEDRPERRRGRESFRQGPWGHHVPRTVGEG